MHAFEGGQRKPVAYPESVWFDGGIGFYMYLLIILEKVPKTMVISGWNSVKREPSAVIDNAYFERTANTAAQIPFQNNHSNNESTDLTEAPGSSLLKFNYTVEFVCSIISIVNWWIRRNKVGLV